MARRFVTTLIAIGCLGIITWAVWPKSTPVPHWVTGYEVTAHPPESIAPGTVIGRNPPEGWSHLVIKSLPRVRHSEIGNIPWNPLVEGSRSVHLASWMFTAFVADVQSERQGEKVVHRIREIALGLGTASNGRDVIITPETAAQNGVELNSFTREILSKGYKTQSRARVVIHGPTLAVVDTPVSYRSNGRSWRLRFRYALLVDSLTGRLDAIVWLLDAEGKCGDGSAAVLGPNTIEEAELIPDPNEFDALGIPSDAAFAVDRLPSGRARVLLPPDLRPLAAQGKYSPAEAGILESRLRELLAPRQ
jgi:hypothetical protein